LPGIVSVTRGWHNSHEINTVDYEPDLISPESMIAALKQAGTYRGIVE
jgi:hypothetical protein